MENITVRLPIQDRRPLYDKRLDSRGLCAADTDPLSAFLVIDPKQREIYTEIDYTPGQTDLEYIHCLFFEVSPYMTRETVVDLLHKIRPLAERLIDAYDDDEKAHPVSIEALEEMVVRMRVIIIGHSQSNRTSRIGGVKVVFIGRPRNRPC